MRFVITTSVALASLLAPAPVAAAATPSQVDGTRVERAGSPKCLASATKVASKKLHTRRGGYFGKIVITLSATQQGDFAYVVCAHTEVAKKYRSHRNVVRQTFLYFGTDGSRMGLSRGDTYANRRKPLLFGMSYVPDGHTFVFKVKIQAGSTASGKVRFQVPG